MAKHSVPLSKRQRDFDQLAAFSLDIKSFNDLYHIRLTAPTGHEINYYPTSEKWQRMNRWYKGFGELIEYLNEIS